MGFEVATRTGSFLRSGLSGISGGGKTVTALKIAGVFVAMGLAKKPGLIDSERNSHKKAVGLPDVPVFAALALDGKDIGDYIAAINEAERAGIDFLIIDSFSHSWISALEMVDRVGGNKFSNGWKTVSPQVKKLIDACVSYPGHVICTMRADPEYVVEKDEKTGKAVPRKVGMAPVARKGTEFEFDVMLDFAPEPNATITPTKTRCPALDGRVFSRNEEWRKVAETLAQWLSADGAPQAASAKVRLIGRLASIVDEIGLREALAEVAQLGLKGDADVVAAFLAAKKRVQQPPPAGGE